MIGADCRKRCGSYSAELTQDLAHIVFENAKNMIKDGLLTLRVILNSTSCQYIKNVFHQDFKFYSQMLTALIV